MPTQNEGRIHLLLIVLSFCEVIITILATPSVLSGHLHSELVSGYTRAPQRSSSIKIKRQECSCFSRIQKFNELPNTAERDQSFHVTNQLSYQLRHLSALTSYRAPNKIKRQNSIQSTSEGPHRICLSKFVCKAGITEII